MDEQQIDVGGQRIAFTREARRRPPRHFRARQLFLGPHLGSGRRPGTVGRRFRCLAFDLPGHGASAKAVTRETYSLPGYAAVLAGFAQATGAAEAVVVGWSLGGHIALEAAPAMPAAAGYVVFGTPPVASAAQMGEAFLPNPAMNVGFTASVGHQEARAFAASFTAPRSAQSLDEFVADLA